MKKYRLKQWYPSLPNGVEVGHIIEFDGKANSSKYGVIELYSLQEEPKMWISSKELHPDFWELIEEKSKPLFVTEDGVEVFSDIDNLFAINLTYFSKTQNTLRSSRWLIDNPSYKVFSIESNADEYIWRNKRVFSYEDMMKAKHSIILTDEDIEKVAKKRSRNENYKRTI